MAHIKSRKHPVGNARAQSGLTTTAALVGLALSMPVVAQTSPAGTATLPEVNVKAQATDDDYKVEKLSSPKFTQPLVDTAQTVTIIPETVMRQQVATTLTEALRNTPGVSTFFLGENGTTSTGDSVFMRGFDASSSIFVDGIRDTGAISRDMFNVQSVEVIKGPSGSDYGRTSPTGSINLVTKQPTLENSASGTVSFGTADQKRVTADINRALTGIDGAAFRLNLMKQDSGVPGRDNVNNDRWAIAPSLAFGLGTSTRTYINFLHVTQNNVPDGGVPTIGLPGYSTPDPTRPFISNAPRVRSANFYGTNSDFDDVTTNMLTAKVEHDLGNGATISNTTRWGRTEHDYLLTSFTARAASSTAAATLLTPNPNDLSTWTIGRSLPTNLDQDNTILTNQTNIRTDAIIGGLKHSLSAGVELTREEQVNYGFNAINTGGSGSWPAANLYNPDPNVSGYTRIRSGVRTQGETRTIAGYAFDTIKLTDRWQVSGGLRYDRYSTDFDSRDATGANTSLSKSGNLFGWKLGVLYKPAENGSIYAAYGVSQQPPGGSAFSLSTTASANNANNPAFAPQRAKSAEIGTKWDVFNKRVGLAAALYRTEISNDIIADPVDPTAFIQSGKKRVQGIELSAVGQVTSAWAITAGLTTMDTAVVAGPNVGADAGSNALNYTPKLAATLWTTYRLPFGMTVGGGARYTGKLQRGADGGGIGTPQYVDSYVVFDAMASYTVTKNVELQLNLYNLFDKDYVASINKPGFRYIPGTSRAALLSANFRF